MLQATTWQTVGPFFSIGLGRLSQLNLAPENVPGELRMEVQGRVLDGDLRPVPDALLEIWQADAHGRYHHPAGDTQDPSPSTSFRGFRRLATNEEGGFQFNTIKPGAVPGPDGRLQAPHLVVGLLMRGLLKRLVTRIYFPNEPLNEGDAILQCIPYARRATLLLRASIEQPSVFHWDIHLQGEAETVFFEF